jgi:hypothetical protein
VVDGFWLWLQALTESGERRRRHSRRDSQTLPLAVDESMCMLFRRVMMIGLVVAVVQVCSSDAASDALPLTVTAP